MPVKGIFRVSPLLFLGKSSGLTVLAGLIVFMAATAGIARIKGPGDAPEALRKEAQAKFRASFDMGHDEIFSPLKEAPLSYTKFYRAIEEAGGAVTVTRGVVDTHSLAGLDIYIVLGPAREFNAREIEAVARFVENGGNLLVALHVSGPVARLTEAFGIIVSNFPISESSGLIDGKSQDFYVTRLSSHPVTAGVKRLAVYGTWGLMAEGGAALVAKTSDRAWADLNRNRRLDEGEPVEPFGVIAVREYGKGKVVVVSDDAPFANAFIDSGDNRKLASNIIRWFKGGF